jgi:hypothetical protein
MSTVLLTALLANAAAAVLVLPSGAAVAAGAAEVAADLRMAEDAGPMRQAAERFIARAMAGDAAAAQAMLSRALVERAGEAAVAKAMQGMILPFFARGGEVGRSVTVTRTTDAAGQNGFAFYMWLVPAQGEARPFTVYMVDEAGTPRVANVVPDRRVEGRHS